MDLIESPASRIFKGETTQPRLSLLHPSKLRRSHAAAVIPLDEPYFVNHHGAQPDQPLGLGAAVRPIAAGGDLRLYGHLVFALLKVGRNEVEGVGVDGVENQLDFLVVKAFDVDGGDIIINSAVAVFVNGGDVEAGFGEV